MGKRVWNRVGGLGAQWGCRQPLCCGQGTAATVGCDPTLRAFRNLNVLARKRREGWPPVPGWSGSAFYEYSCKTLYGLKVLSISGGMEDVGRPRLLYGLTLCPDQGKDTYPGHDPCHIESRNVSKARTSSASQQKMEN